MNAIPIKGASHADRMARWLWLGDPRPAARLRAALNHPQGGGIPEALEARSDDISAAIHHHNDNPPASSPSYWAFRIAYEQAMGV